MTTLLATETAVLSRRTLFRQSALLAGGAMLTTLPFGRSLLAHDVSESWPNVAALAKRYVESRKLANLFLTFGWDQQEHAHTVGGGTLSLARPTPVDENSLFRIYSMSKPITGMATMILIDEGKLILVVQRHEPLQKPLQELFLNVALLAEDSRYRVWCASKPHAWVLAPEAPAEEAAEERPRRKKRRED